MAAALVWESDLRTYVRNLLSKIYVVSEESRPWTNLIIRPQKFTSQKPNVATSLIPPPNPTSPKAAVDNRPLLHPIRYTPQVNNLIN